MARMAPRVTLVSNGHGEDALGAALARELRMQRPELEVVAFPLVGLGTSYLDAGIAISGPTGALPSAGLTLHAWDNLYADLRAGWLALTARQVAHLARLRTHILLIVGDLWAQLLASSVRAPARFVYQPLVSILQAGDGRADPPLHRLAMERITVPEQALLRARADRVYVRDAPTAAWLQERGVPHAVALGNPAVDAVAGDAPDAPPAHGAAGGTRRPGERVRTDVPRLALLPGSRGHALRALAVMLDVVGRLGAGGSTAPAVAWAHADPPAVPGWTWRGASGPGAQIGILERSGVRVRVLARDVAGALRGARIALATSGTATEQAAAAGVPVVSFPVPPEHTGRFLDGQKRLLGGALTVVQAHPEAVVDASLGLLRDDRAHALAARVGRERMGPPGGTRAIVRDLLEHAERLGVLAE